MKHRPWIPALFVCLLAGGLRAEEKADSAYLEDRLAVARSEHLSQTAEWRRLGHYRHGIFGWTSEQDGPDFFLSPRGKRDPEAELEATIRAFFAPASPDTEKTSHAQCHFPARYAWLKGRLAFDPARLPEQACPRFESWRERLAPGSVSLIFASAYLSNPASMYGHTFLRLNRKDRPETERLNDYCVNFAADTPTSNGVVFAVKGLFGGYAGIFSTIPYYMQVQRYNNIQSRDLWEYDLVLSSAALDRLVRHLWEMGGARFDYFFLTENCSYALLPLLEAADPSLRLSERFHVKVIPVDTVRAVLDSPGLVGERRMRLSQTRSVLARRSLLTSSEVSAAERIGREKEPPSFPSVAGLVPERQALVLDAGLDLFRYRHGFSRFQSTQANEAERRILIRRGQVAVDPGQVPEPPLSPDAPPESGHRTGRIAPGLGRNRGILFEELSLRPALQDFLDDPTGYVPASRLEMFHLILRHREDRDRVYVQRLGIVDIQSMPPLDSWVKAPSWKAYLGFDAAEDRPRAPENALAFRAAYGKGVSVGNAGPGGVLGYALGEGEFGAGPVFDQGFRTGVGATAGLLWRPFLRVRLWAEGGAWRYFWGDVDGVPRGTVGISVDATNRLGFRARFRRDGEARETLFSLAWFL
ncbi:MAG: DUF4105 domain-containing protein [Elusimicrobia bacterium]|nr:DUF4105 domain-containing protein [Elusimicrobiota bacterium]